MWHYCSVVITPRPDDNWTCGAACVQHSSTRYDTENMHTLKIRWFTKFVYHMEPKKIYRCPIPEHTPRPLPSRSRCCKKVHVRYLIFWWASCCYKWQISRSCISTSTPWRLSPFVVGCKSPFIQYFYYFLFSFLLSYSISCSSSFSPSPFPSFPSCCG